MTEQATATETEEIQDITTEQDGQGADQARDDAGRFTEESPQDKFAKMVAGLSEEKPGDETDASAAANTEQQSPDDESPEADPAATSGEGPSAEWLAVATAAGVPQDVLSLAKNDEALQIAIAMADQYRRAAQQAPTDEEQREALQQQQQDRTQTESTPVIEYLLDDTYDESDPVVKQTKAIISAFESLRDDVDSALVLAGQQYQSQQQASFASALETFDKAIDAAGWQDFGVAKDLKSEQDPAFQMRAHLYPAFKQVQAALPDLAPERIAELAYERTFGKKPPAKKDPQQKAREEAIVRSSQRRLGGGHVGPPAPEPDLSPKERFEQKLAALSLGN